MDYLGRYKVWLEQTAGMDEVLVRELYAIKGNAGEIESRFYRDLEFGTGGLRGIMGAGTNRMNIYTVRRATQGLANYLRKSSGANGVRRGNDTGSTADNTAGSTADNTAGNIADNTTGNIADNTAGKTTGNTADNTADNTAGSTAEGVPGGRSIGSRTEPGQKVVIAYDSRRLSREFAMEAALILANNGIQAHVFRQVMATPVLSYAVRKLAAGAGIVITASHNPPEYNGYKVYGADGGQITDEVAKAIMQEIELVIGEPAEGVSGLDEATGSGLFRFVAENVVEDYLAAVRSLALSPKVIRAGADHFRVVYTPLHGTGGELVESALSGLGFKNIFVVPEQAQPDGDFPTVQSPNPEEHAAFELAIKLGQTVGADLLLATDPDADRLGVAVKNESGEYFILTGNQLGALLLEYLLARRQAVGTLPENGVVVKTIVTSELGRAIAGHYGLETVDTLTGFKYIGEKIREFHEQGNKTFVFGYEESYGYLIGDFVRDKDAIQACQLAAEMTLFYQTLGMTLAEKLEEIFQKYGYYREDLVSFTVEGKKGQEQIGKIMASFRREILKKIDSREVMGVSDYLQQQTVFLADGSGQKKPSIPTGLPAANVLKYLLADDSWFCIRPSGTEPKLKVYFGVREKNREQAESSLTCLQETVLKLLANNAEANYFLDKATGLLRERMFCGKI